MPAPSVPTFPRGQPLVSVVTPFHNTADFLAECIESVLAQTYSNFEYVLVDNCSTDGGGDIAASYAAQDARIKFHSTPTLLNQVANYNNALTLIDGRSRYCKFAQADDWLFPQCVAELTSFAEHHPEAVVVGAYASRGLAIEFTGLPLEATSIPGRDVLRDYFRGGPFVFGNPTTVLYRTDSIRAQTPFFDEHRLHEDTERTMQLLLDANLGFVHQVLSFIRYRDDSIMGQRLQFLPGELDRLITTCTWAPEVLSPTEVRQLERTLLTDYYEKVGKRVLLSAIGAAPEGFWEYQRSALSTIGRKLSVPRIATGTLRALGRALLSPLDVFHELTGRGGATAAAASRPDAHAN